MLIYYISATEDISKRLRMRVLPIKMDSYSNQSVDSDMNSTTPNASVDFSTLINSPQTQTSLNDEKNNPTLSDAEIKAETVAASTVDDTVADALTESLTQEMNFFVGQIDLANQANHPEAGESGLITDESVSVTPSNNAASVVSTETTQIPPTQNNQISAETTQINSMQTNVALNTMPAATDVVSNKNSVANADKSPLNKPVVNNDKKTDLAKPVNTTKASPKSLNNLLDKMNLSDGLVKMISDDDKNQLTDMNKKHLDNAVSQDTSSNFAEVNNVALSQAILSTQKEPIKNQEKSTNKFEDSLNDLGKLINSLTAQQANQIQEQKITSPNLLSDASSMSYAQALKKVNLAEFDTHVELMPQSIESHLKDSYSANIKIYPPELGSVLAKLKVDKNNAELVITTESSAVKEIVESNLAQLRENFQRADITITHIQVNVAEAGDREQKNQQPYQSSQNVESNHLAGDTVKEDTSVKLSKHTLNSIIDAYI
jgi:flagellar hook-length control protein FliK